MPENYDLLKIFHVVSISLSVSCLAISFYKEKAPFHINILSAISSIAIVATGFAMTSESGLVHGHDLPLWPKFKSLFWLILIIVGPVLSKKLKRFRLPAFYFLLSVGICSAVFAIIQPEG